MTKVNVYNLQKQPVGEIELDPHVFGAEFKQHLLHLVVRKQLAKRRAGTAAVKHRAEVNGGGKKPWKQKGTGRARQGTTRAPQWRGGGVVFGPTPRSYDFKVNKKEMAAALRSAISRRVEEGAFVILDDLAFDTPKTKNFTEFLARFDLKDAVVVVPDASGNVKLAARNLQNVTLLPPVGVNVYDVLKRSRLVLTTSAVQAITARLGGQS